MARSKVFIVEGGALFRGVGRAWPDEVWNARKGAFEPYEMGEEPKPVDWGEVIDQAAAEKIMGAKA